MLNKNTRGSVLGLVMIAIVLLLILGGGLLAVSLGVSHQTAMIQNETAAMAAAEAGFEKAVFWMSRQSDMISALGSGEASGTLTFDNSSCEYNVDMAAFIGASPVYEITSVGHSGEFTRTVSVHIIQAVGGWSMGMCRVPSGSSSTTTVNYVDGEVIEMPIHINSYGDPRDSTRDIHLVGDPVFLRAVSMSESRYSSGGSDKYGSVINVFDNGIYFNQPSSRITDPATVATKVGRFRDSTDARFKYTPDGAAGVPTPQHAVHLEFFVDGGVGKVRVTNNCAVRGYRQNADSRTWDFRIDDANPDQFERYYIYAYHMRPTDADATGERAVVAVEDTYVTQSFGDLETEPGGQIYVDGNVVIGSGDTTLPSRNAVKGRLTVVATGNIWVADSITAEGSHDADGKPSQDNPNALGLIALGVVKVVDPGMSSGGAGAGNPTLEAMPTGWAPSGDYSKKPFTYVPIGIRDDGQPNYRRHLPDPVVVEAGMTVGGGGWGAENVQRGSYGNRKEASGVQDDLVLRGTLAEATRGVVGLVGSDGFLKNYYLDERLLTGILPGDIWLRGKFVPLPAGWKDYRASND